MLPRMLKSVGLTQRALAIRLGKSEAHVSQVMSGKKLSIPSGEKWAVALGLKGAERELFMDAVHLSAASPRVRAMFARLERENKRLKKRLQ
jgi:transcriptional regulator with XRE-family HTH domain